MLGPATKINISETGERGKRVCVCVGVGAEKVRPLNKTPGSIHQSSG